MSNKRDDPDTATNNVRQTHKFSRMSEAEKTARRRYLMFIEYNGNDFSGSQRQKHGVRTVQAECETALTAMTKEHKPIKFSSRTDAGVHALANSAHVDIIRRHRKTKEPVQEPYTAEAIMSAMNHHIRRADTFCRVTHMQEVSTDMHSRHHAVGRTYVYRIVCPVSMHQLSIFELNRCWAVEKDLDLDAMREAAEHLKGTQDFSSFRGAGCTSPTPVKTIECLEVLEQPACPHWAPPSSVSFLAKGQLRSVVIKVRANAFLYHMVRLLVGWLVEVGSGQQEAAGTPEVLQQKAIQALKCGAAPPCGLYLAEVHYNPESFTKPSPLRFADEVDAEDSGGE